MGLLVVSCFIYTCSLDPLTFLISGCSYILCIIRSYILCGSTLDFPMMDCCHEAYTKDANCSCGLTSDLYMAKI